MQSARLKINVYYLVIFFINMIMWRDTQTCGIFRLKYKLEATIILLVLVHYLSTVEGGGCGQLSYNETTTLCLENPHFKVFAVFCKRRFCSSNEQSICVPSDSKSCNVICSKNQVETAQTCYCYGSRTGVNCKEKTTDPKCTNCTDSEVCVSSICFGQVRKQSKVNDGWMIIY